MKIGPPQKRVEDRHARGCHDGRIGGLVVILGVCIARDAVELQALIEPVVEEHLQGLLPGVVVIAGLTHKSAEICALAICIGREGAKRRQELLGGTGLVIADVGQQRDGRVVRWPVGEGGRDHQAVVAHIVNLRVRITGEADDAIEPLAVLGQRAAAVELELFEVERAIFDRNFVARRRQRQLGDAVDNAAHRRLTIEHGGRPAQHFHALQGIGLDGDCIGVAEAAAQPINEVSGGNAANIVVVAARIHAEGPAQDPGGIAQRLLNILHALVAHLLVADHGDGLGRLDQRGIGLGTDA